jgi:hypothetical protein
MTKRTGKEIMRRCRVATEEGTVSSRTRLLLDQRSEGEDCCRPTHIVANLDLCISNRKAHRAPNPSRLSHKQARSVIPIAKKESAVGSNG